MATDLVNNVKEAPQGFPITSVFGWLDSSVDQRERKLKAICEQSSSEDPGQELNPLATPWNDGQPC